MRTGRRFGRHLLADLRASRSYLAAELSQSSWLDFGAFRWHDLATGRAARAAFGVITPLAIGVGTGHVEAGSFAALGALPAGFISFRGVTRSRVLAVALAAAGMAVSTFIGAVAEASHPLLLIPVIFVWAYAAGLLAALGPTALVVSLQWPVALLIASALPLGPAAAGGRALLVLAGGLWQAILVVGSWAVARGSSERTALAQSFLALARVRRRPGPRSAGSAGAGHAGGPEGAARPQPADAQRRPDAHARPQRGSRAHPGHPHRARHRPAVRAAGTRRTQPAGLGPVRPRRDRGGADRAARSARRSPCSRPGANWPRPRPNRRPGGSGPARRCSTQLRAACQITERLNEAEPARREAAAAGVPGIGLARFRDMTLTLRASLGTSSEAGRHALRLAVVTALAEVIVRAIGLPHGYWGVLTIFIVLRPDYSSTLYRGLQRAAGTVVGAGLGLATVQLERIGLGALLAGVAVSLLAAYAVFTVNYLLYAVFLTDFVVVLLVLLGQPAEATALARLAGTGIGTGLALLAYLFWPTWAGSSASEKLARLLTLQGRYAAALLRAYTRPGAADSAEIASLRLAVRRARIDADASADRLAGEPDHPPMTGELARSLTSAAHRIAQATITLTATLAVHHARPRQRRAAAPPDIRRAAGRRPRAKRPRASAGAARRRAAAAAGRARGRRGGSHGPAGQRPAPGREPPRHYAMSAEGSSPWVGTPQPR